MARASKATPPDPDRTDGWQEPSAEKQKVSEAIEPISPHPPIVPRAEDDAIGMLLGRPVAETEGRRRLLRSPWLRWALFALVVSAVAVPMAHWFEYQSVHVTSKNAAVRGHLAEIGTRISGQVIRVNVDVGDRVRGGDVLAELQSQHLAADVQEARADVMGLRQSIEVERLQIELERREIAQRDDEADARVAAAEAQTDAARIDVENAKRAFELRESLYERDGAISSEDLRGAESETRSAQARLEEAQANAAAAQSVRQKTLLAEAALDIRRQRIGVLEADLVRAEARLARAEANLDAALIRAPGDGAIVRRIIQPGGSIEVGQPVVSMLLGDDVWVEAWIDEEDIGHVRLGDRAMVTFHSFPGRKFAGMVDKIGLATDLEMPESEVPKPRFSRMRSAPVVGVRIRLDQPPRDLLPGLSAVVAIDKGE